MTNIVFLVPDAMKALQELAKSAKKGGVPETTTALIQLRASQVNGCGVCVDMHSRMMKKAGETDDRLFAVATWRDTPYFTDAERAALALAEAVTRLSDRAEAVSDEIWNETAKHYDEAGLAALIIQIGVINVWNRFNAATRQIANPSLFAAKSIGGV
jgi:AhpD family alkylhydroperoxidase